MVGALLATVPMIIVFFAFRRAFIGGLSVGRGLTIFALKT